MRKALMVVNMGGPANESEVREYLKAIFKDPRILTVPDFMRRPLAALIVMLRTRKVMRKYSLIGGGSPLLKWTMKLVDNMTKKMTADSNGFEKISFSFRYSVPTIPQTMEELKSEAFESVTVLPLFPHYTEAMSGSIFAEAEAAAQDIGLNLTKIPAWGQHPRVIEIQGRYLRTALNQTEHSARVIFVAHGIPLAQVKRGDSYTDQVEASARVLSETLPEGTRWSLAYQSKVGPIKWTGPYLEAELKRLCASKEPVIIMPLSFVADCLETLYDLDIVAAEKLKKAGIEEYIRVPVFNDDLEFAEVLLQIADGTEK